MYSPTYQETILKYDARTMDAIDCDSIRKWQVNWLQSKQWDATPKQISDATQEAIETKQIRIKANI